MEPCKHLGHVINSDFDDAGDTGNQAIRRIWSLPRTAHSDLLPLLSRSLPIRDEIYHRSLTFILQCISHKSPLIRRLAVNSILSESVISPIGRNLIYCARRYKFSVRDCLTGKVEPTCVRRFYNNSYAHERLVDAELLRELTNLCEGSLSFVDDPFFLSHDELRDIIAYITSC
jgi:hypothetical protein